MKTYGQFCSIARALELLAERWTLLIIRELLCGSETFTDIRRGIPRISRTMLSARLRQLVDAGVVARGDDAAYRLTEAGAELGPIVLDVGRWGQRWLSRAPVEEQMDIDVLLWDMQRRARREALPAEPFVVRFELTDMAGAAGRRYLLMRPTEVSACRSNLGYPERVLVETPRPPLFGWWRGDVGFDAAVRAGLRVASLDDPERLAQRFPEWFDRYLLADVPPAVAR